MRRDVDSDIKGMSIAELRAEVRKLRKTIRQLRDRTGHDLCWFNPEIWKVLPEKKQSHPKVPEWSAFMQNCARF